MRCDKIELRKLNLQNQTQTDTFFLRRLITGAKQAEIMYIENNHIKSATAQFGHDAFEAFESGDEAKAKALFNACKTLVDAHRADVQAAQAEIDRLNAEIAVVGEDQRASGVGNDAADGGRGAEFAAPRSGNSLNDL
jgi:hypothetical protein